MKKLLCVAAAIALTGCAGSNSQGLINSGMSMVQAATLGDDDVKTLSDEACADSDKKSQIAPASSKYSQRLTKIMAGLKNDGVPVQAKVYLSKTVNAWAMANGCVRVYSGIMDLMSDDEVRGVLGHEIGHVALGHSKAAMQVAYAAQAARGALAASGNGAVSALSSSQLGDLTEKLINAQFSQKQESAADDYAFDLLKKNGANRQALVTAFQKLATQDGGKSSMFDSHPGSAERAQHLATRLKKEG